MSLSFGSRRRALLGLALVPVALFACSSGAKPTAAPTSTVTTVAVESRYPLTVTDMLGREVTIESAPTRIVSVSPTATETLYSVGGKAIARDSSSTYPPDTESLESVGGAYNPNIEQIVALRPDLILIEALSQAQMIGSLAKAGAPVVAVRAASAEDVVNSMNLIGKITGLQDAAGAAGDRMRSRIQDSKLSGNPSVLILIGDRDQNLYAAKPESYPGAVASALGASNVAQGLPDSGPFPGFTLFSSEQAVLADPDFILTISPAPAPAPRLSSVLGSVPGYGGLSAVTNGQVLELDPVLFLEAPGPRMADAAETLKGLMTATTK